MRKIAFFDLDGTLCHGYSLALGDGLLEAFDQLRENEVQPVIATGRSFYEVKDLIHKLKVENFILSDGCYAYFDGVTVLNEKFSKPEIESILMIAEEHELSAGYFNQQGYAVTDYSKIVQEHVAYMGIEEVPVSPTFYQTNSVNFMNLYMDVKKETQLNERLSDMVDRQRVAPLAVSLLPKNVSKGSAIKKVLAQLGDSEIETYAFGDNNNDLTMFQLVDHGVAMAEATEQLKDHAAYVSQTENGVLEGLVHYGLIS